MVDGAVSHDQITDMLAGNRQGSKELWLKVKPAVRKMQSQEGVVILDQIVINTIAMKNSQRVV